MSLKDRIKSRQSAGAAAGTTPTDFRKPTPAKLASPDAPESDSDTTPEAPLAEWSLMIGEIVAPFGLKGEMKVRLETDFPDRFAKLKRICVRPLSGEPRLYDVEGTRLHKGQILLRLRGIDVIEKAETLRNSFVQVRVRDAVRLPADEYYIHDLLGCEIVTDNGRILGTLQNILRGGANDVYVIGEGKDEILLPAIKDVVRDVDLTARRIVVSPTPGLLPGEAEEVRSEGPEIVEAEDDDEADEAN